MITARFVPVLELKDEPEVASRLFDLAAAMTMEDFPDTGTAPYKGLYPFVEADVALFYGREKLTDDLMERISASLLQTAPSRCVF